MTRVLVLLLVVFALLVGAIITRSADLAWMALPFLLYLIVGLAQTPAVDEIRLSATRSANVATDGGPRALRVTVLVTNQGKGPVQVSLSDPLQRGMTVIDGQLEQSTVLRAGETGSFDYTFETEHGEFAWKTARGAVSDLFGLVESEWNLPAEASVQVYPTLDRFRPFPLRVQHTLHSPGSISARRGGSGTDFWGIREYHPGDPLRRLDWRLTARHPRRFFTREFEQEETADIALILDGRQRTELRVGKGSLFEHAARATASLAEAFLRQGNRVSLLIYQQHLRKVMPGYGKLQLNKIVRALAIATPEEDETLTSLKLVPIESFSNHSLTVVVSPLALGDWQLFPRLRAFGNQVLLISPDPIDYARQMVPVDPTTGLAVRLAQIERQIELDNIARLWIPVINWQVSQPLAPLVRNALRHSHIQRER